MLASEPSDFAKSEDIEIHYEMKTKRLLYVMTNQELEFHVPYRGSNDDTSRLTTYPGLIYQSHSIAGGKAPWTLFLSQYISKDSILLWMCWP